MPERGKGLKSGRGVGKVENIAISEDPIHRHFMLEALGLAAEAGRMGETPVGAIVVSAGTIVGAGHNLVEQRSDPTAHAEMLALRAASQSLSDWRLPHCTVYVTLEPCIMCVSAMIHARLGRLVFGAPDIRWGGAGSLFDLTHDPRLNHEIEVISGVREEESRQLLKQFFNEVRRKE